MSAKKAIVCPAEPKPINYALAKKVYNLIGKGLTSGLGERKPGKMCVEAAVAYACGEPHNDKPKCVKEGVAQVKICLNDLFESYQSNEVRGKALRKVAIYQLGSKTIPIGVFENYFYIALGEAFPLICREKIFQRELCFLQKALLGEQEEIWVTLSDMLHLALIVSGEVPKGARRGTRDKETAAIKRKRIAANFKIAKKCIGIVEKALERANSPGVALWQQLVAKGVARN